MSIKESLANIVGKENVSDSIDDLRLYSKDLSFLPSGMPDFVAWPKSSEEVGKLVAYCNENNIPVVPVSSRVHANGNTIPKQGGLVIDMKRMNKIFEIDLDNRLARFEAGVTWQQLHDALKEKGCRAIMPLAARGDRSVLTDTLEREVPTNIVYDYGEPTQSLEIVWADGSIFRCGSASVNGFPDSKSRGANPSGPGLDFYRFMQGAQGTMGIVTWMSMKIEFLTRIDKIYVAPITDLKYAQDFLYRVLPRRVGQECVLLSNVHLAGLVSESDDEFEKLAATLPPWTLAMVISGVKRRPEEKIAYEENFIKQVIKNEFNNLKFVEALPGFPGLSNKLMKVLKEPWQKPKYWKEIPRGNYQDIVFVTKPEKTPELVAIMDSIAAKNGYAIADIGKYIQPIEHNRASHVEFTLFYNGADAAETALIKKLNVEASLALMAAGAFFSRPYGDMVPIIFDRAGNYTATLRRVKNVFDPKNIMNPGTLCF